MAAPTMRDVASAAGVSQATVSLVLNGSDARRVSPATARRVHEAVEALGYRTNAAAKTLKDGVAPLVGFIGDQVASAPFAGAIVEGAQERAWENGLLLLMVNTGGDKSIEHAAIDQMLSHQVRQFVYASMYNRFLRVPKALAGSDVIVLNGLEVGQRYSSVSPNEVQGGYDATRHLIAAGHRRVAMINIERPDSGLPAAVGRHQGYQQALAEAQIEYREDLVRIGGGSSQWGLDCGRELLDLPTPPTAIFCANDRTAWGVYQAAAERNLRIPDELSIVGFDNQELLAGNMYPGLTTMNLPFLEMGRKALDLLTNPPSEPTSFQLTCELVERGSVAPAKDPR